MLRLDESGRPVTGGALARATVIPRATVQRRLAYLTKKGVIYRKANRFCVPRLC
jgi:DNA-binding IclR family transcriptional regulator